MEYMVASGKSVLTRAGQINEFQAITPKMIGSGSIFEGLIKIGTIVPKGDPAPVSSQTVNLRPPVVKTPKAQVKEVEVIEPEVKKIGKPDMPDEAPKRKYMRKKNLFGDEQPEEKSEEESEGSEDEIKSFEDVNESD